MSNTILIKHGTGNPTQIDGCLEPYELGYWEEGYKKDEQGNIDTREGYKGTLYIGIDKAKLGTSTQSKGAVPVKIKIEDVIGIKEVNDAINNAQTTANTAKTTAETAQTTAKGKAPKNHASSATTYGQATDKKYGHVKLSDLTNYSSDKDGGIAATPSAVKEVNELLGGNKITTGTGTISFGDTLTTTTINYGHTYTSPPVVFVSQIFDTINLRLKNVGTTSFQVGPGGTFASSGTRNFYWIAIGK